jgi:hypothetical protein
MVGANAADAVAAAQTRRDRVITCIDGRNQAQTKRA